MNERFYSLSQDKQQRIINAAYKVFALNSYKKAPMSEIANEAEISKALLFHYFRNKKDLYLYLWDNAADLTQKATIQFNDSIEIFCSRDCFHIVTRFQKLKFFHFSKPLRCTYYTVC